LAEITDRFIHVSIERAMLRREKLIQALQTRRQQPWARVVLAHCDKSSRSRDHLIT